MTKIRVSFVAELLSFKPHAVDNVLSGGLNMLMERGTLTATEAEVARALVLGLGKTDLVELVQAVGEESAPGTEAGEKQHFTQLQERIAELVAANKALDEELSIADELQEAGERCARLAMDLFEHNLKCRKSGCWQCAGHLIRLRDWSRTVLAKNAAAKRAAEAQAEPAPSK